MATPTLGNVPTTINDAEAITNWTGTSINLEPDLKVEGANSIANTLRNDLATIEYNGMTNADYSGQHIRCWINFSALAYLDTEANSGMEFYINDGTNTAYWVVFGSDSYYGGWFNTVVYIDSTPDSGTVTSTSVDAIGYRFNRTAAPRNVDNCWVDYMRYGDGYYFTGGTTGDRVLLADVFGVDNTNAYGILAESNGVFFAFGKLTAGNGATTTWFEMDGEVLVFTDQIVNTGLYEIIGAGSGCNINIINSVIRSSGTNDATRFGIDMSDATLASMTFSDNLVVRASTVEFASGDTATGNTFDDCGQITHGGATMNDTVLKNYEGTAGTAAIIYNVNADPDGEIDGLDATMGTALTHVIELGTNCPTNITLRDWTVSGYNSANGQNDSVIYNNSNKAITINVVGNSGTISYRNGGSSTTTVQNTVNFSLSNVVSGTTLYVEATAGGSLTAGDVMVAATTVNTDPYTTSLVANQPFKCVLANASGATKYIPIIFDDTTGTGFSRRIEQVTDGT